MTTKNELAQIAGRTVGMRVMTDAPESNFHPVKATHILLQAVLTGKVERAADNVILRAQIYITGHTTPFYVPTACLVEGGGLVNFDSIDNERE